jgi:hypothetical protein
MHSVVSILYHFFGEGWRSVRTSALLAPPAVTLKEPAVPQILAQDFLPILQLRLRHA